jgi:DNA modification methylase
VSQYKLFQGDNVGVMRAMKPNSVDAVITDTPYGTDLAKWDNIPTREHFTEMLRVAKPGAYLAAFGAPRTSHKMASAAESAGWEIKDILLWLYAGGFAPASINLAENIDKLYGEQGTRDGDTYVAATPEGKEFEGFGVGLKPAYEPIILARKPGAETVAENLVRHGVGALDIKNAQVIDGQIVGPTDDASEMINDDISEFRGRNSRAHRRIPPGMSRWPSNVLMDVDAAQVVEALVPGASRFFFCGKAAPSEREAGLQHLPSRTGGMRGDSNKERRNNHPTVKPIAVMRWLVRLLAPKGSVILDPYMGSGTTGCAVGIEGGRFFIGIELMQESFETAEARIAHWSSV